jgi:uncharacterized membrane protein
MKEWLSVATETAVLLIDAMALVIVVFGTLEAFFSGLFAMFTGTSTGFQKREIWLRYGRSLVAGLTFQLAADILESAVTLDWEAVARLASIAVIRTFLNYFLERDLADIRERQLHSEERRAEVTKEL